MSARRKSGAAAAQDRSLLAEIDQQIARTATRLEKLREVRAAVVDALELDLSLPAMAPPAKTRATRRASAAPASTSARARVPRAARGDLADRILAALAAAGEPLSRMALARAIGLDEAAAYYQVKKLVTAGRVIAEGATSTRRYRPAGGPKPGAQSPEPVILQNAPENGRSEKKPNKTGGSDERPNFASVNPGKDDVPPPAVAAPRVDKALREAVVSKLVSGASCTVEELLRTARAKGGDATVEGIQGVLTDLASAGKVERIWSTDPARYRKVGNWKAA